MTTAIKLNSLLLPLFVSILLSTVSKLKIGPEIDNFFYTALSPITVPTSSVRLFVESKFVFISRVPLYQKENKELRSQLARLLSENEYLKQTVIDQNILENLSYTYKKAIPVRLSGSTGKFVVSSSHSLTDVKPGQPLVSGNVLLGTVLEVKGAGITITPLESEKSPSFPLRLSSGQKGFYKYLDHTPQVVDIPSQFPVVLGEFVFTEPGEIFPGNLIIGKIVSLITINQEPLQKAEIELFDTLDNYPDNLAIITEP